MRDARVCIEQVRHGSKLERFSAGGCEGRTKSGSAIARPRFRSVCISALRDAQCQQNHSRVAYTSPFALSGELTVDIMTPSVLDLGFLVRPDGYSLDYLPVWTVDDRGWARSRSRQVRAVRKTLHVSLQLSHRGNSVGACAGSSAARRWSVARCRLSWPWLGCAFTCLEPGQVFRLQSRRGDRSTLDVHTGSPLLRAGRQPGPLDDAVLAGGASRRSGGG